MTPEQIAELIEYLKNLGELAIGKGFELAMRQVYVLAMYAGLWFVAALFTFIIGLRIWKQAHKTNAERKWNIDDETFFLYIVGGCLMALGGIVGFYHIGEVLAIVINPEWRAIDLIFGLVTGG